MDDDATRIGGRGIHDAPGRFKLDRAWFDAPPGEIVWSTRVKFERRIASAFAGKEFALCGDAAHVTGPVGVQSMNLGFAEAYDLVERIARVIRAGADPRLFAEYDARWRAEWEFLLGISGELVPTGRADAWIAQNRARIPVCLPGWGEAYRAAAGQLGLDVKVNAEAVK